MTAESTLIEMIALAIRKAVYPNRPFTQNESELCARSALTALRNEGLMVEKPIVMPLPEHTFSEISGEWFSFNEVVPYKWQHIEAIEVLNGLVLHTAIGGYKDGEVWDYDGNDWNGFNFWRTPPSSQKE